MSRRPFVAVATAVILIFVAGSSQSSWEAIPLTERIKDAELVVVGQLTDLKPQYFSITWHVDKYYLRAEERTDIYDVGNIRIDKILKGSWHEGQLGFAFDHANQPDNPFRHMKISFTENQRGIWLLHRGTGGFFYVRRPDNFLNQDSLKDVQDALKTIEGEAGAVPKIIVRKRPEPDADYIAFFQGRESWPRTTARSKYEAVGQLILILSKDSDLHIEFEVIEPENNSGQNGQE